MIVLRKFCSSLLLHFLCCCSVFCFSLSRITCSILSLLSFLLSFACCLASSFLYSRWYEVTNRLSRELRADPSGNCLSPPSLFSSGFVEGGLEDWGVAELESSSSSSRWSSRGGFVPSSSAWGRWILVVFFLLSCECARLHMNYLQYCGARAWQQGILWRAPTPWNFVLGTSLSLRSPPHSKFDRRRRTKARQLWTSKNERIGRLIEIFYTRITNWQLFTTQRNWNFQGFIGFIPTAILRLETVWRLNLFD